MVKRLLFSLFILTSSCRAKECFPLLPSLVAKILAPISNILVGTSFEIQYSIINLEATHADTDLLCGRLTANSSHAILIDSFRVDGNFQWQEVWRDTIDVPTITDNGHWEYKRSEILKKTGQYKFGIEKDAFNEVKEEGE